jgi:hypothetical protein
MGLREYLNKNKPVAIGLTVGLFAVGAAAAFWLSRPSGEQAEAVARTYYTVDDGATYFADAVGRVCPFEHEGKQAVLAGVFKCTEKEAPFVGYLERVEEGVLAEARAAEAAKKPRHDIEAITAKHFEVKRPGEDEWVKANSPEGEKITTIQCPTAIIVLP